MTPISAFAMGSTLVRRRHAGAGPVDGRPGDTPRTPPAGGRRGPEAGCQAAELPAELVDVDDFEDDEDDAAAAEDDEPEPLDEESDEPAEAEELDDFDDDGLLLDEEPRLSLR
ncbi:hypothetical protein GCM10023336_37400 [Streptomyces similanensis]|uniref:DNA primase n=1 Tax=Streptomyces similanensis TaxID=1274988 RepID=A0ABP9KK79_9ACTN